MYKRPKQLHEVVPVTDIRGTDIRRILLLTEINSRVSEAFTVF